jgi:subtilisin family serine protease
MPVLWNKLDSSLSSRYGSFLRGGADATLLVSLSYEGDLAAIEAAGFETAYRGPQGYATGDIRLSGLESIAAAPGVVRISFGHPKHPMLDESVPKIHARPDVWQWDAALKKFVGVTGKGTGKGVVVGIIDTGIDWQHPFFLKESEPLKVTRILAIWDMGLRPDSDEVAAVSPDAALLSGLAGPDKTYGVEYNFARIEAALNNGPSIRHRDCYGHGTHVASIAAGNGGPLRNYVGVAPEADIIVVKAMSLQNTPRKNNNGAEIGFDIYFCDAVRYILNKAAAMNKPAVINASLGASLGPHDGFTTVEDWLTNEFNAKPKACMVVAAGNDAAVDKHAIIRFTGPGVIHLNIEVNDLRVKREDYSLCVTRDQTPTQLDLQIYYPPSVAPLEVGIRAKESTGPFQAGPARDPASDGTVTIDGFEIFMTHAVEVQKRDATHSPDVLRSRFWLQLIGKTDEAGKQPYYHDGVYTLSIEATEALTAHVWMDNVGPDLFLRVVPPVPPSVTISDEFLISTPAGSANVVTVAAYNPNHPSLTTLGRSSRGPLVNYASSADHPVPKPDVAAPGEFIDAAASREVHSRSRARKNAEMVTEKQGTSMAAPHVAGVVALMFENNPNLKSTEILNILRTDGNDAHDGNDPIPAAPELEQGKGRVNAKKAFDKAPTP